MEDTQVKNPFIRNIFVALSVLFVGFTVLVFSFVLLQVFQFALAYLIKLIFHHDPLIEFLWFPQVIHILYIFIVTYTSFLVLGSGLSTMYKAAFSMVPFALIYLTFYVFYFPWPDFVYFVSILFYISVFYFFYKVRVHWLYYYSFTLVSISLYILSLTVTK